MKVTQTILLTLFILSISASSASASLQLNNLFSFPVNFNSMQMASPFINYNALADSSFINDSNSPTQIINDKSILNTPDHITTVVAPTSTSTPTPLPDSSNHTAIMPSPTPIPSPSALPTSTSGNSGDGGRSSMTQTQKEEAIKIAGTSPLCSEYNIHPDDTWNCVWISPSDGHTISVGKQMSDDTNFQIIVDLHTQKVVASYRNPSISEVTHHPMY